MLSENKPFPHVIRAVTYSKDINLDKLERSLPSALSRRQDFTVMRTFLCQNTICNFQIIKAERF